MDWGKFTKCVECGSDLLPVSERKAPTICNDCLDKCEKPCPKCDRSFGCRGDCDLLPNYDHLGF